MSGYLSEIFASFEGEGDRVGMPAVFVRLGGCNLSCSYCDTGYARERTGSATLYVGRRESTISNPVSPANLSETVGREFARYSDLRITGGEPLLQAGFLKEAAVLLRRMGFSLHLETNGTLPDEMSRLRHLFDTVTMDVKLPSTQEGDDLEDVHRGFLESLSGPGAPGSVSAKIVVTPECDDEEVECAFSLVASVNPRVRVFLQPESDDGRPLVTGERMLRLTLSGLDMLNDVRISFQMHKILRMR
jgi:7-carboxy-7-deazaguanine synthase